MQWLSISLEIRADINLRDVVFLIGFKNVSAAEQQLPFSNRSRKAELLGLILCDNDGIQVSPERRDIINLRDGSMELHLLLPDEVWHYELIGKMIGSYLEFPGAAYRIEPNREYSAQFVHMGRKSPKVSWRVEPKGSGR